MLRIVSALLALCAASCEPVVAQENSDKAITIEQMQNAATAIPPQIENRRQLREVMADLPPEIRNRMFNECQEKMRSEMVSDMRRTMFLNDCWTEWINKGRLSGEIK